MLDPRPRTSALKQQAETGPDHHGNQEMQGHADIGRIGMDQPSHQGVEMDCRHPPAEGPAADDARHAAADDRAAKLKGLGRPPNHIRLLLDGERCGKGVHQPQGNSQRQPEAKQVGDEFGEMGPGRSAAAEPGRMAEDGKQGRGSRQPQQQEETPDSRAGRPLAPLTRRPASSANRRP